MGQRSPQKLSLKVKDLKRASLLPIGSERVLSHGLLQHNRPRQLCFQGTIPGTGGGWAPWVTPLFPPQVLYKLDVSGFSQGGR